MGSVQELGLKVEPAKGKTEQPWKLSQRQSKDGASKTGQKLRFSGAMGTQTNVDSIPADLNKICVSMPPSSRATITVSMNQGMADRKIIFVNASPVKTMTGRIYIDQDTGKISVVKDPASNGKTEGPANNKFQTRRTLTTLEKDVLEMTQHLSAPLRISTKSKDRTGSSQADHQPTPSRRRPRRTTEETAWHLTDPQAKKEAKLASDWRRLNFAARDANQQHENESAGFAELPPLDSAKKAAD